MALPLRYADIDRGEAADRAKVMLEKSGLGHRMDHLPHECRMVSLGVRSLSRVEINSGLEADESVALSLPENIVGL